MFRLRLAHYAVRLITGCAGALPDFPIALDSVAKLCQSLFCEIILPFRARDTVLSIWAHTGQARRVADPCARVFH